MKCQILFSMKKKKKKKWENYFNKPSAENFTQSAFVKTVEDIFKDLGTNVKHQAPVVQSVVSLTTSLRVI